MTTELSEFQQRVLMVPAAFDLALTGGRGGGKSYCMALLALRHLEQYGNKARVLFIRRTYRGCADFEALTLDLFGSIYGRQAKYNTVERVWRLPGSGTLEIGQLEGPQDYGKFQGRSFSLIMVDEAGQYSDPAMLDKLRSNMRGPKDMPIRMVMSGNPGDVGHQWLANRYVFQAGPWQPFYEEKSKRHWVYAPSTFLDNPHIDQDAYKAQLEFSCPADDELLRAWLDGDWAVARGSFFAGVLDEKRNAINPWPNLPDFNREIDLHYLMPAKRAAIAASGWNYFLAHDYGSSAPSVTYLCAESPGAEAFGHWYPRGSIILFDELATNIPGQLNSGLGWTIPVLADAIKALCNHWKLRPEGCADDACFSFHGHSSGSIAKEFQQFGVYFKPARKSDRLSGWERMRRLLQAAGQPDVPGLYISRRCEYFWQTVPFLGRDMKRTQDLDTTQADHAADAVRYACLYNLPDERMIKLFGT